MGDEVVLRVRCPIDDATLSALHARAFGFPVGDVSPWAGRLARWSLTWVGAFDGVALVGFVNAVWDGGLHAFLLDPVVEPDHGRRGVGTALVRRLVEETAAAGCHWLHVDYEPHLRIFYEQRCGFRPTDAGLVDLRRHRPLDPTG